MLPIYQLRALESKRVIIEHSKLSRILKIGDKRSRHLQKSQTTILGKVLLNLITPLSALVRGVSLFVSCKNSMGGCVRGASDLQEPKMWIQVAGAEESAKHIVNELRASNVLVIILGVYILSLGVQRAPREQYVERVTGRVRVIVRGTNCRHALIGLRMILVNLYLVEEGQGGARLIEKKALCASPLTGCEGIGSSIADSIWVGVVGLKCT
jgi:hypothetical protein